MKSRIYRISKEPFPYHLFDSHVRQRTVAGAAKGQHGADTPLDVRPTELMTSPAVCSGPGPRQPESLRRVQARPSRESAVAFR